MSDLNFQVGTTNGFKGLDLENYEISLLIICGLNYKLFEMNHRPSEGLMTEVDYKYVHYFELPASR